MKNMETYIKAVGRRLNLPKDVKQRVMSDFASSIHARQEAGQTDAQILAELGDAQKAAADLNEQMKESNPMLWVQTMNNLQAQAEELILSELVYS